MSLSERSGLSSTTTKAFIFFQSRVLGRAPAGSVQAAAGPAWLGVSPGRSGEQRGPATDHTPSLSSNPAATGSPGGRISVPLTQPRQHGAEDGLTHARLDLPINPGKRFSPRPG